ncbi:MAG: hypothetical protein Q7J32_10680 [Sphingomonadaceae bacterium]|nr:hypothetical protein [Sphingomonadaceae bacterium]
MGDKPPAAMKGVSMSATFLRRVLAVDAIGAAVSAVALIAASATIAPLLGLPASLIEGVGIAFIPFAAFVGWLASREAPPAAGVWAVILLNALWVVESLLVAAGMWFQPNSTGVAIIVVQALGIATLAELEYVGLKKMRASVAA